MKVLILGAKGMLGFELQRAFAAETCTLWDKEDLDISDADDVKKKLKKLKPDLVVNAAAYTAVDECENHEDVANKVNGDAVGYIATSCADIGAVMMHFSTDYVFDGEKDGGYTETETPNPLNAYGRTKLQGESLLQEATTRFYLIRTSWLYGRNGKNFVDMMLTAAREKRVLRVVNDQHGCPTYAKDLADAAYRLVREQAPFGIYHLVNSGSTTWFDFAKKIFAFKKLDVPVEAIATNDFPRLAKRPKISILQNTKAPALRHWEAALQEYLTTKG